MMYAYPAAQLGRGSRYRTYELEFLISALFLLIGYLGRYVGCL